MTAERATPGLWQVYETLLARSVFVDLTHAFHPGQPHLPVFPDEDRSAVFDLSRGDGFTAHRYSLVGQWGTHVDPPVHFVEGGRTLDELPVDDMVLPLVVLDISARAAEDPDTTPTLHDVESWEARHGPVPRGAFVALRTDWHRRWPDSERMENADSDGVSRYPGWSQEVLTFLIETRGVTAVGHEQTNTDPGTAVSRSDFGLEHYVLARDRWQIELMANLDRVPEAGALLIAAWPKPRGGTGFPARLFAVHTPEDSAGT